MEAIEALKDFWLRKPIWNKKTPALFIALTAIVTLLGGFSIFYNIDKIEGLVFDENYYTKQAQSMLLFGVEMRVKDEYNDSSKSPNAGELFAEGRGSEIWSENPDFVAHPPLGKLLIAPGLAVFGSGSAFGWRFTVGLFGVLSVLIMIRMTRRLFRNETLGIIAGVLMVFDGAHLISFRTGILDPFLAFFVLAAVACFVLDRDSFVVEELSRNVGRRSMGANNRGRRGVARGIWWKPRTYPIILFTKWRLLMFLNLALAASVKWSGLPIVAAFCILMIIFDISRFWGFHKRENVSWFWPSFLNVVKNFFVVVPMTIIVYLLSWSGWFFGDKGYNRFWHVDNEHGGILPGVFYSFLDLHKKMMEFNTNLTTEHPSQSHPVSWLFTNEQATLFYKISTNDWIQVISFIPNPALWWSAGILLLVLVRAVFIGKDKIAWFIFTGLLSGWGFWFLFADRTIYNFYAIVFEPFIILIVIWFVWKLMEFFGRYHWVFTSVLLFAVVGMGIFFYPIWVGDKISLDYYNLHLWLSAWK